ncbi:YheU family protein [Shewanella submarina]|uniref:YheU family protein n=1 Tax=Shewanella submarina TaxID=2016376 RepID=A0ABV7G9E3_9GAMM|nr:YheU family protein [Shewanella submarina]MCL1039288.1 YheU family protein [Shewanella submarina]
MLIPYNSLLELPEETLNNLIREYLFTQVEDGGFDTLSGDSLKHAMSRCRDALKRGELVVEYGEEDESIAIRNRDQIIGTQN